MMLAQVCAPGPEHAHPPESLAFHAAPSEAPAHAPPPYPYNMPYAAIHGERAHCGSEGRTRGGAGRGKPRAVRFARDQAGRDRGSGEGGVACHWGRRSRWMLGSHPRGLVSGAQSTSNANWTRAVFFIYFDAATSSWFGNAFPQSFCPSSFAFLLHWFRIAF